ncbi:MAG: 1-acyl-sn-glycerol-3-phosphate acyltransferase [Myxococcota bacterium]|jgi:1-acyl-sn-glycerol-3-phosphate acyltransferase
MRAAAFVYGIGVLVGAMLTALLIGTVGVLPFAVVPRGRRERYSIRAAQLWAWVVIRGLLLCSPTVTGDSGLRTDEGAVVFCNHRSWVDPLLLIVHLRSNGLSKREILFLPAIGLYGWLSGAIFMDRRSEASRSAARHEVVAMVRAGNRIQVFPEGTRSRDGALSETVYLGTARDAYAHVLPVIPCAVMHTERCLPAPMRGAWPLQRVRLHIGSALRPADYPDSESFALACWGRVRELVEELREEASPGV